MDSTTSITSGAKRLLMSSKGIVAILFMALVAALALTGKVAGDVALEAAKWVIMTFFGSVAVEDGAKHLGGKRGQSKSPPPVEELDDERQ